MRTIHIKSLCIVSRNQFVIRTKLLASSMIANTYTICTRLSWIYLSFLYCTYIKAIHNRSVISAYHHNAYNMRNPVSCQKNQYLCLQYRITQIVVTLRGIHRFITSRLSCLNTFGGLINLVTHYCYMLISCGIYLPCAFVCISEYCKLKVTQYLIFIKATGEIHYYNISVNVYDDFKRNNLKFYL